MVVVQLYVAPNMFTSTSSCLLKSSRYASTTSPCRSTLFSLRSFNSLSCNWLDTVSMLAKYCALSFASASAWMWGTECSSLTITAWECYTSPCQQHPYISSADGWLGTGPSSSPSFAFTSPDCLLGLSLSAWHPMLPGRSGARMTRCYQHLPSVPEFNFYWFNQ